MKNVINFMAIVLACFGLSLFVYGLIYLYRKASPMSKSRKIAINMMETKPVDIADAKAKIHNIDFIIDSLKKRRAELGVYIVKMVDSKESE